MTPTPSARMRREPAPGPGSSAQDGGPREVDDFVTALLTASRVLIAVSARSLGDTEDAVTLTQFRTLVVLDSNDGMSLLRLAEILDVTSSTAMRMIDRLLTANLATRRDNPDNRRQVLLGLTAEGRALVRRVTTSRRREMTKIVAGMPSHRRAELIEALREFSRAAGEPDPGTRRTGAVEW